MSQLAVDYHAVLSALKGCYERLLAWLGSTAPQLEAQGNLPRLLARQPTVDSLEWLAPATPTPAG